MHRFKDTKKLMSPEIGPKSFGTFVKRALDLKNLLIYNYCMP